MSTELPSPLCPGCGGYPDPVLKKVISIPWFCTSDSCHVLSWNPNLSIEEIGADIKMLDLSCFEPPKEETGG